MIDITLPIYVEQDDQVGMYDEVDRTNAQISMEELQKLIDVVVRIVETHGDLSEIKDIAEEIGIVAS